MNNECNFLFRIIADSVPVFHFGITEDAGNCIFVKPNFAPFWNISLHIGDHGSTVSGKVHASVSGNSNVLDHYGLQKTVTLD